MNFFCARRDACFVINTWSKFWRISARQTVDFGAGVDLGLDLSPPRLAAVLRLAVVVRLLVLDADPEDLLGARARLVDLPVRARLLLFE